MKKEKKIQNVNCFRMPLNINNSTAAYCEKQHGGRRIGSGRKPNDRKIMVCIRISQEAADILYAQKNKSAFIDNIIKKSAQNK